MLQPVTLSCASSYDCYDTCLNTVPVELKWQATGQWNKGGEVAAFEERPDDEAVGGDASTPFSVRGEPGEVAELDVTSVMHGSVRTGKGDAGCFGKKGRWLTIIIGLLRLDERAVEFAMFSTSCTFLVFYQVHAELRSSYETRNYSAYRFFQV